jgi:hypothetical protein
MFNLQDYSVLYATIFARLFVGVDFSLTCGKSLHDCIISWRRKVWAHKASLIPSPSLSLFIEMQVPSREGERSCICVLGVSILPLSVVFPLNFRNVPTVWYFFLLSLYYFAYHGILTVFVLRVYFPCQTTNILCFKHALKIVHIIIVTWMNSFPLITDTRYCTL